MFRVFNDAPQLIGYFIHKRVIIAFAIIMYYNFTLVAQKFLEAL